MRIPFTQIEAVRRFPRASRADKHCRDSADACPLLSSLDELAPNALTAHVRGDDQPGDFGAWLGGEMVGDAEIDPADDFSLNYCDEDGLIRMTCEEFDAGLERFGGNGVTQLAAQFRRGRRVFRRDFADLQVSG